MHKCRFAGRPETYGREDRFERRRCRSGPFGILHVSRMGHTGSPSGQVTLKIIEKV